MTWQKSGVEVGKAPSVNFAVMGISDFVEVPVGFFLSHC